MHNILVTGAGGFIGSHLVRHLKVAGERKIVSLIHNDHFGKWHREVLEGTIKVRGDVRDTMLIREIIARYEIDQVYHLAAIAIVKTAYRDPMSVFDINVMGTVSVLEACRVQNVPQVLVLITDKVYGDRMEADEDSPYQPGEPYATSKCCQGFITDSYMQTYGMKIISPHPCNAFGYDPYSNRIFPNTIKSCIKGLSPVIFCKDDSLREYIYVEDIVEVLHELMNEGYSPGHYNIATGWVYNQSDIVLKILKHFPDLTPTYSEGLNIPQIKNQSLKSNRFQWQPMCDFDTAIEHTIDKFTNFREDWV